MIAIKSKIIIKSFLVIAVAAFNLAIMPGSSWADKPVRNAQFITEYIHGMNTVSLLEMREFCTVIRLYDIRSVTKVFNGSFDKVHGGITTLFTVWINEPLPGSLVYYGVLVKLFTIISGVAGSWNVLYIRLPFYSELRRSIMRL